MALMNHPHKKKEPFPGQGERRTEIRLQAKMRRRSDVMLVVFTNNNVTLVHSLRPKWKVYFINYLSESWYLSVINLSSGDQGLNCSYP